MRLMIKYLRRHWLLCLLDVLCVSGFVMTELGLPFLFAKMIDNGVLNHNLNYIKSTMYLMIAVTVIGTLLNLCLATIVAKITTTIVQEIRNDLYATVQKYSHSEYDQIGMSSLITRLTNDAYQIMLFLNTVLRIGVIAPVMFGFSIYLVLKTNLELSVLVLIALPILVLFVIFIGKKSEPLSVKQQSNLDGINQIMRENLSGIRVIRAFARENFEEKRFAQDNKKYQDSSTKLFLLMAFNQPVFNFLFLTVIALILWFGAKQITLGHLAIGNYMAVVEYIFHAMFSLMLFATIFIMYPRANVSAKRIEEANKLTLTLPDNGNYDINTVDEVEFKNVDFVYPKNTTNILDNISLTAKKGETIAFIGGTGSGKSTLLQLIPRLYDVTKGEILINDISLKDYKLKELRKIMSYIPQKPILFEGTIADNLRFGNNDATEEEMWKALEIAQAKDFVMAKEGGLNYKVAEGGSNFSGGQKQRLAIARALVRKPQIYLFDDSFSALDFKTDAKLRDALKNSLDDLAIMFIVAQRVSTIMKADKIIVLDKGKIVGSGTHEELLLNCPHYVEIVQTQFAKEELA